MMKKIFLLIAFVLSGTLFSCTADDSSDADKTPSGQYAADDYGGQTGNTPTQPPTQPPAPPVIKP